eukprot:scaffold131901_cov31-Tisochrysis_lutea.AAC.1
MAEKDERRGARDLRRQEVWEAGRRVEGDEKGRLEGMRKGVGRGERGNGARWGSSEGEGEREQ